MWLRMAGAAMATKQGKNLTTKDLKVIAEAKRILADIHRDSTENIAKHTGYDVALVQEVLEQPYFQDLYDMYVRGQHALWGKLLADEQEELSRLIARLGYKAYLRLAALLESTDEKVANQAIRTTLEYNADLERPVVRHEITTKYTADELDKAREVVRKARKTTAIIKLPEGPVN